MKFYKQVNKDLTPEHRKQVQEFTGELYLKKEISEQDFKFLSQGGHRTSVFYMFPKIHKNKIPVPCRPTVSSCDSPTEKISMLLDIILQPYVLDTKSHIRDTSDFLQKVSKIKLKDNGWLFTMDIMSLYTNIPHDEGISCIKELLNSKRQNQLLTNENLLRLLEMVLKLNNFTFNNKNYLQINGTAMGTRVAHTYANLFMDSIERKYIYLRRIKPRIWFRFIDDVWGIFQGTEAELLQFVEYCNSFHDLIKFTIEYSMTQVAFLDVITYRYCDRINSTLYIKPNDTHSYLDYNSCHPQSNKSSIPYSQFLRIRRNCTKWIEFLIHSIKLYIHFSMRGYPHRLVSSALVRVNKLSQTECMFSKKEESIKDAIYCIIEFNSTNPPVKEWIQELWPTLYRSSGTRTLIDQEIVFGFRKPKSLQDILVHTNIYGNSTKKKKQPPKCKCRNCRHCPLFNRSGEVKSHSTNRIYRSLVNITCNSSNLIYLIECIICGIQYVGQTKNKILIRMNQHYSSIKNRLEMPVSRHFNSHLYQGFDPVRISILSLIREDPDSIKGQEQRNKWENYWMARLYSYVPKGLNIKD